MDNNSLPQQIRLLRENQGLTQQQLADFAQISRRPIYLLETGKGSIGLATLLKIVNALGYDLTLTPKKVGADE